MTAWILIVVVYNSANAVAVTTVPGFPSERACLDEAAVVKKDLRVDDHRYARTSCVRLGSYPR